MSFWHLYVVRTRTGDLYTGIATDVDRRFEEHCAPSGKGANGGKGAKYLRGRGPLELALRCPLGERGLALRAEYALKRLPKAEKERVIRLVPDAHRLLRELGLGAELEPPPS